MTTKRQEQFRTGFRSVQRVHSWATAKVLLLLVMLMVSVAGAWAAPEWRRSTQNSIGTYDGVEYLFYKTTAYGYCSKAAPDGDNPVNGGFNTTDPSADDYMPTKMVAVVSALTPDALASVMIPSTVTHNNEEYTVIALADNIMRNSPQVLYVTIPSSVRIIEVGAFYNANNIRKIVIDNTDHDYREPLLDKPLYCYYSGEDASTYRGAFAWMSGLQTALVRRNLLCGTPTKYAPFYNSTQTSDITINVSAEVTSLPDYCFAGVKARSVDLDGQNYSAPLLIPEHAFDGATMRNLGVHRDVTNPDYVSPFSNIAITGNLSVTAPCSTLTIDHEDENGRPVSTPLFENIRIDGAVNISSGAITSIPSFRGCTMTSVMLPPNAESIKDYAFSGCTNLRNVDLNNALKSIGYQAFENTAIEILNFSPTKIQYITFLNSMSSLKTIILNKDLIRISNTFNNCPALEVIDATRCENLERVALSFGVSTNLKSLKMRNAPLGDDIVLAFLQKNQYENLQELTLPAKATRVPNKTMPNLVTLDLSASPLIETLSGNIQGSKITNIYIPKGIKEIPADYFNGCYRLRYVTYETGTALETIGDRAFCGTAIPSITVPDGVSSIGEDAFAKNKQLTTADISNVSLTSITKGMFYQCDNLATCILPSSITSIEQYAFNDCKALATLDMTKFPALDHIGQYAFAGTGLKSVTLLDKVSAVDRYAFKDCVNLESITFGKTSSQLPLFSVGIVSGCTNLQEVHLANATGVTSIPDNMFKGCNALRVFDFTQLPNLESIGKEAFYGTSLENVLISDKVTSIGEEAFASCKNLSTIRFGVSNSNLTYLGNSLLANSNVENVVFARTEHLTEIPFGTFRATYNLKNLDLSNLPNVTTISGYSFRYSGLESIVLPVKVASIGEYAFQSCESLNSVNLESLNALTSIGDNAFANTALTDIILPDNLTSIGKEAFQNCESLNSVNLESLNALTSIGDNAFANTALTDIILPDNLTSIGKEAFASCASLKSLQIGKSNSKITTLGEGFASYASLETVTFKNATLLTAIPANAFRNNNNLKSFDFRSLPNLTTIGNQAFWTTGLTSVVLSDNVTSVGWQSFANCQKLVSFQFGTSSSKITELGGSFILGSPVAEIKFCNATLLTKISDHAFENFLPLSSFDFSSLPNLTAIGDYAFYSTRLQEVDLLSDKITSIGEKAFAFCDNLEVVKLGKNCRNIGKYAFEADTKIKIVNLQTDITSQKMYKWDYDLSHFHSSIYTSCILSLEETNNGSQEYKNQMPWKQFQKVSSGNYMDYTATNGYKYRIYKNKSYSYDIKDNFGVHNIDGAALTGGSFSGDVVIPDKVLGFPVIAITKGRFNNNSNVTSISFPGTLRMIENNAVEKMKNLKKVTFRDQLFPRGEKCYIGYAVYNVIDEEAFYECDALEEVSIGCDIDWYDGEDEPFEDRENLKTIRITKGCQELCKREGSNIELFNDCNAVDYIIIEDGDDLLSLCKNSFDSDWERNNDHFEELYLGRTIADIEEYLDTPFDDMYIQKTTVGDCVTRIAKCLFTGATLVDFKMGKNIKSIGYRAFYDSGFCVTPDSYCPNLEVIDEEAFNKAHDSNHGFRSFWFDPDNPSESKLRWIGSRAFSLRNYKEDVFEKVYLPATLEFIGSWALGTNGNGIRNVYFYPNLHEKTVEIDSNVFGNIREEHDRDILKIHTVCANSDKGTCGFPGKIEVGGYITNWKDISFAYDLHVTDSKKGSTLQSDGLYHEVCANCGGNDRSSKTGNYYIHNWNGTDDIMIHKSGSSYSYNGPLAIDDSKPFKSPVSFSAESVSYNRTVTGGRVATFVLPFAADASDVNGTVYKFREFKDSKFCFDEQTGSLDANTPYLVVVNEEATQLLNDVTATSLAATVSNTLSPLACNVTDGTAQHVGSFVQQTFVDGDNGKSYYGYASNDGMFVKAQTATLNPFRTMFTLSQSSNANARIRLQLGDDDTTSIIEVNADELDGNGSPMYDLNGRVITSPVRGQIYIQNGKKISGK